MGDDGRFAADYARSRGLVNHAHVLRPDLVDLLPRLMWFADDPIADPTMINTYLICEAARRDSKVLLSGMGADEVAGGYRRHVAASMLRTFYRLPSPARSGISRMARMSGRAVRFEGLAQRPFVRRVSKALGSLPATAEEFATGAFAQWTPDSWLRALGLPLDRPDDMTAVLTERVDAEFGDSLGATMAFDLAMYLPSHNLHYVDKMSMAASVEVRVPYMDNALADFLGRLPYGLRVDGTIAKATLRRAARAVIPDSIIDRPKTGFAAPIRGWLAGPLRELVRDHLSEHSVRRRGLLSPSTVQRMIDATERGTEDLAYSVWALLSYELWCRAHVDSTSSGHVLSRLNRQA
jgi:asparagine synthase (glutamine-hydrolysing)